MKIRQQTLVGCSPEEFDREWNEAVAADAKPGGPAYVYNEKDGSPRICQPVIFITLEKGDEGFEQAEPAGDVKIDTGAATEG